MFPGEEGTDGSVGSCLVEWFAGPLEWSSGRRVVLVVVGVDGGSALLLGMSVWKGGSMYV